MTHPKSPDLNQVIKENMDLVKKIAYNLLSGLPANVLLNDLIQSGVIGLIEAYHHFDPNKGASFETYAGIRVRGSMLDEIRKGDWAPRSIHRNRRQIATMVNKIEQETGRKPSDVEVSHRLGVSLAEYHAMLVDTEGSQLMSLDDLSTYSIFSTNQKDCIMNQAAQAELYEKINRKIKTLPFKEASVISMYYQKNFDLKTIGVMMGGLSESRVSQMHSRAVERLRKKVERGG